ncbi:MAG: host-nuclease inhibitor Gam family protein [Bacteroidales bacterium]
MAKREKKVILSGITPEEMNEAMGIYAQADAEIVSINSAMDAEFTQIRDRFSKDLAVHTTYKEKAFEIIQAYALENRESLFSKKKSMENAHGVIGFRIGTPKLKTKKGFTWAAVLELLKTQAPRFIRTSEEVAKDRLLADRESEEMVELMPKIGIEVVQDESFFIELKKEELS